MTQEEAHKRLADLRAGRDGLELAYHRVQAQKKKIVADLSATDGAIQELERILPTLTKSTDASTTS